MTHKKTLITLFVCLFAVACCQSNQLAPYEAKPANDVPAEVNATEPKKHVWPYLGEEEKGALAPDLLAKNYYVILDNSGSMAEDRCTRSSSKSTEAKTAIAEFIKSIPAGSNVGLAIFDTGTPTERAPLGSSQDVFFAQLNASLPNDGTPLSTAVALGFKQLTAQGAKQLGYGEYHLVIVTDGEATPASQDPTEEVNTVLRQSPILIHTIGFCIEDRHSLNQPGRTFYTAANNPEALRKGLQDVLAEAPAFTVTTF